MALGEMDLRRLEILHDLASHGAWHAIGTGSVWDVGSGPSAFRSHYIIDCPKHINCDGDIEPHPCYLSAADAAYIEAVRDALPDLIALARRALEVS